MALGTRLLLVIAGLGLTLIVLELALQLGAVVREGLSERPPAPASDAEYVILAVGESTTAPFGAPPYPRLLEEELRRRDPELSVRVVNGGRAGAHTTTLVERLPEQLDTVRPQVVVLMMGINDHVYFDESHEFGLPLDLQLFLLRFRVYRLGRLLKQRLESSGGASELPFDPQLVDETRKLHRDTLKSYLGGQRDQLEPNLRRVIAMCVAAGHTDPRGVLALPRPYKPIYREAHKWIADFLVSEGRAAEAVTLLRDAAVQQPGSPVVHRELARILEQTGDASAARKHFDQAAAIEQRTVLNATQQNFREARRLIRERGMALVAMQYPLRSVATLRYMLDDADDVLFVSNEEIFREEIARVGYEALFLDRFAGDFGHGTRRGNMLIARNLAAALSTTRFGPTATAARGPDSR